jgi:C-terminal processing protease CtpA/Prc
MNSTTSALLVTAMIAGGGLGAALAPVAHGQTTAPTVARRAIDVFGGRGSQIGVSIRDVEQNGSQAGVVIEEVTTDSPAEKAGIKKGDVVVEFDGERVRSVRQFTRLVQETPAGRKAAATLMRDGQRVNVTIEPRENNGWSVFGEEGARVFRDLGRDFPFEAPAPPAPPAAPGRPVPPAPPTAPFGPDIQSFIWRSGNSLGMTVSDLSPQLAAHFGAKNGVLVTSVSEESAAAKAGVKAGDVVSSVNGSDVSDPSDLRRRIQQMQSGDEFRLGVVRDRKSLTLTGKWEAARTRRITRSVV